MSAFQTFVDLLRSRSGAHPERPACVFLQDGEEETERRSYGELDARARALAVRLRERGAAPGDRVLLLFPPGLDFIDAFLGCLYAGVVAVPCHPPRPGREQPRLKAILEDAGARFALGTAAIVAKLESLAATDARIADLERIVAEAVPAELAAGWRRPPVSDFDSGTLAFLQYTSGSTATPKGVMVTHGNLLFMEGLIADAFAQDEEAVVVGWLPVYHDMGLIGNVLQPLWLGARCVLMSPVAFLRRPRRWLEAISRYRATTSGGPNFAYELCVERIGAEERRGLDLSSWRVAFNGAEPVRATTLERFADAFAETGFRRPAFRPCYGLAEATLLVSGSPGAVEPVVLEVGAEALEQGRAEPAEEGRSRRLVGCGTVPAEQPVAVVDPETGESRGADRVGEIWVRGPGVAAGYWNRPEETAETFGARLEGTGPWLRTGDLGFLRGGSLFVTGRLKDLIILRGRNHYPQDLELTAGSAAPGLSTGAGAAFAVESEGEERLVVVQELEPRARPDEATLRETAAAIRRAIAEEHEVQVHEVLLVKAGAVPKTSSGKIQRRLCRSMVLEGRLEVVGRSRPAPVSAAKTPLPQDLEGWLRAKAAEVLRVPVEEVDPERPLLELGLDSLAVIELGHAAEMALGITLPPGALLEGASVADLARRPLTPWPSLPGAGSGWERGPGGRGLSLGQRALWFLHRLRPDSRAYNLGSLSRVHGDLSNAGLRAFFQRLVDRHPALRTTFHLEGEELVQRVQEGMAVSFEEIDASGWTEEDFRSRMEETAWRPFDLERGPLFRVALFQRGGERMLVVEMHHIVSDFGSLAGAVSEEGEGSAGAAALAGDFAAWQEQALAGAEGERWLGFWRERLAGLPELDLPTDRVKPENAPEKGGTWWREIGPETLAEVKALARSRGATLYVALLAAFQALLHRYTGQEDFAIGSPVSGRPAGFGGSFGYFTNAVVLRADLAAEPSFAELVDRTRRRVAEALDHQHLPLTRLVEHLGAGVEPFRAMFVLHRPPAGAEALVSLTLGEAGGGRLRLEGFELEPLPLAPRAGQFDVTLAAGERRGALGLQLVYDALRFDATTAARWLEHLANLLAGAVERPDAPVSELPLLSPWERHQVLLEVNDTSEPGLAWTSLHEGFQRQAGWTPEAVALIDGERRLTYGELRARAAELADRLRRMGVGPETVVGVRLPRTAELVVTLLGVLEAGAAYLPLDPAYPEERIGFMVEDAGAALVITPSQPSPPGPLSRHASLPPRERGRHLAYLIYTSGSTGRPKGVAIEHASAVRLVAWASQAFSAEELRGVLAATSVSFDLSIFEIFVPLSLGGTVILAENALALPELPARDEVTLINTVPSAIAALLEMGDLPASVRTVNLAGEPLRRSLADRVLATGVRLWDLYGPSEDTTYSTGSRVAAGEPGEPLIGGPVAGSRGYVVDRGGRPLPLGVPGELWLGGGGLARGYLGRPALTAEKFLPDPFGGTSGGRVYRTGDLVRRRSDGALDYLGRIDHQVKIRGFRIELGEIEAALLAVPFVREAVVVARDGALAGYVAVTAEAPDPVEEALRESLRRRLPAVFVPAVLLVLEALPRTPNGKVDRKALPSPERLGEAAAEPPVGLVEETLAALWEGLLGRAGIGRTDRFFDLGGHSLLASRVTSRVREAFGVELPLAAFFEEPTLAGLARRIERARGVEPGRETGPEPIPRISREGDLPLSFAQQRLWFLDRLEPGTATYNLPVALRLRGDLDVAALERALTEIVRRHEALRTTFHEAEGEPVQRVAPAGPFPVAVEEAGAAAFQRLEEEAARPFDLENGPVFRALLLRIGPQDHLLLASLHHIVSDGWSLGVLVRELSVLYGAGRADRPAALAELPLQSADWAVWQRLRLSGALLDAELAWWREALRGLPERLDLPVDHPRRPAERRRGGRMPVRLDPGLTRDLAALGRREGVTLFTVLLAGFQALLGRWSGQEDLAVGSPVAGRTRLETEELIGLFVNTLVLRADLSGDPDLRELLRRTRRTLLAAHAHQELPFEKLVEELAPVRELGRTPLFEAMLAYQGGAPEPPVLPGLTAELVPVGTATAKLDLELQLAERGGALDGFLEYDADLFEPATLERFLGELTALLRAMAEAPPGARIADLPLPGAMEREQLLRRPAGLGESVRELGRREPAEPPFETPLGPVEERLAAIWSELLGSSRIGRRESFFERGGHSLLAAQVVARVRRALGVRIPLRAVFEEPTLAGLAARIAAAGEEAVESPLAGIAGEGPAALSFAQQRLWFLAQLDPASAVYNIPAAVRLRGTLDVLALRRALNGIARRHETLRTTFRLEGDEPRQVVGEPAEVPLPSIDLRGLGAGAAAEARRLALEEAARPFDLQAGPVFRALLLRLSEDEHRLLANMHHIVSDGWSLGVFTRELAALHAGAPLPELAVRYRDFAAWQRTRGTAESDLAFWRDELRGLPAGLDLPADRPRPPVQTYRGAARPFAVGAATTEGLRRLARSEGATLFMALLAGFQALLGRWSGQEDLAVGTPVAGRGRVELEGLIGFFVNTLVLRGDLAGDPGSRTLIGRARERFLAAQAHQDLPFEKLVEELKPERNLARPPLFQVLLVLQNMPRTPLVLHGLEVISEAVETGTTKLELQLTLEEGDGGLAGSLDYNRDLFEAPTMDRFLGHLAALLAAAVAEPERPAGELPILSAAERAQLAAWNATAVSRPAGATLPALFAAQVDRTPEAVAVRFEGESLTYRELDERSSRLAWHLRGLGVGPDAVVAVALERSLELIVALYAVHKAGGAYLPLDPSHPDERLGRMVADSGAVVVVTLETNKSRFAGPHPPAPSPASPPALAGRGGISSSEGGGAPLPGREDGGAGEGMGVRVLRLDTDHAAIASESPTRPPLEIRGDHLAYVIFTSGSTGAPKGAMNTHAAIANRLLWMQDAYRLDAGDRVLQKTPSTFDVSVWEFFWPLLAGARLVVARPEGHRDPSYLLRTLIEEEITVLHFVPSMLQVFLEEPGAERAVSVRQVMASGEALPADLARRFFERLPGARLHNLYGPTEAAVDVTAWTCEPGSTEAVIPIGQPIANLEIRILDRLARPLPVGAPGELCIGGAGLARGYLGRPDLTADRFIPDPESPGARLYRTGDLARWRADGRLEYLGRIDHQVKIRGMRIEPGEIEAALAAFPAVREAVVLAREDRPGDRRLVAYLVVDRRPGESGPPLDALRGFLRERLPEPLVPSAFVLLDALPLSANGKLDRRALPAPEGGAAAAPAVPPRTATEEAIAAAWREALGLESVGVDDSFFDLGGHSLLVVQVHRRLAPLFPELAVVDLFRYPTIAALAGYLSRETVDQISLEQTRERAEDRTDRARRQRELRRQARGR